MGQEQQKVLEMVASGKITPEEGVRLLNALTSSTPHKRRSPLDLPEIKLPRIDLGPLSGVAMELKNTVVDTAEKARGKFKESKAGQYLDPKTYEIDGPAADGIQSCALKLQVHAGKLKLRAGDTAGLLFKGKARRVPHEPKLHHKVIDGSAEVDIEHSLGAATINAIDWPDYSIDLDNAAADTELDLQHLKVPSLSIDNNAGSVALRLGDKAQRVKVSCENNAGSVRLDVPGNFALRVVATQTLSSSNFEQHGLKVDAGSAQSPDWEHNERRCEIVLSQNVASFELRWKRGPGEGMMEVLDEPETISSNGQIPSGEL